jgi:predicted kinase
MVVTVELVILVGLQASGKSSFYGSYFARTHVHVSKDLLRNSHHRQARQMRLIEQTLGSGRSVVVDNTNPRAEDRRPLIALARSFGAKVVGYRFEGSVAQCLARNANRAGRARVPNVAIYSTARIFELPTRCEGFDALFRVRLDDNGFGVEPFAEDNPQPAG